MKKLIEEYGLIIVVICLILLMFSFFNRSDRKAYYE